MGVATVVMSNSIVINEEPGTKNWVHLGIRLPGVKIQALPWQGPECLCALVFSGVKWEQTVLFTLWGSGED